MVSLFASSGYFSLEGSTVNSGMPLDFAQLPPILRVLLTADGTVTKCLESFFWEPVNVHRILQQRETLTCACPALNKQKNDSVIARNVILQGVTSQRIYARAYSYICPEVLPTEIRLGLEQEKIGIGELLREYGLETYRELFSITEESIQEQTHICRTYRILMGKKPLIQITEKFPLALYARAL